MKVLLLVCAIFLASVLAQTQTCPRCTPLCQNGDGSPKLCGDDGCGGSCGVCSAGQGCCNGVCACQPNCVGRQCGDDGCGYQSCGQCSSTQTCQNGLCVGTPTPDCTGRLCGSNRAGGSCGGCPAGQRCRAGQCECYYDCNERNCGNAVQPDGSNFQTCPQRSCGTCPTGFTCGANGRCSAQTPCTVSVTVVDCGTRRALAVSSSVLITQLTYTTTITVSAGLATSWSTPGLGEFSFQTTSQGYLVNTQSFTLTATTTAVELCVTPAIVQIDVRNILTNVSIEVGATINYSGVISGSLRWNGVTSFTHGGFGSYSFTAVPDSRYQNGFLNFQITSSTTLIIIYVQPNPIPVTVVDCTTRRALATTASVAISGSSSYSATLTVTAGGSASWAFPSYSSFTFSTSASGYLTNSQTFTVSTSTTGVEVCVSPATVQIDVRQTGTSFSIEVGATISYTGVVSGSFRWNGITTFTHGGFGSYSFVATPDSKYNPGTNATTISASTTLIIIFVDIAEFCGNGVCANGETASNCFLDCVSLFLEFENADGSGPVNGPTVNYFLSNPRDANADTGPNRNNLVATTSRTTGSGSNTVLEETYGYDLQVYFEVIVNTFITFYWRANTSNIDPGLGIYRLRVHLSRTLGSTDFNYRVVNTWKPIDATPEPYGPTDLNLHLFHPSGALDINNPTLTSGGFAIGRAVSDSKQSGGPATMDISPGAGAMVAVWNSKPPRNAAIAPSQANRYLVDSGSYIVFYGKTSNAANGKQLGQVVMDEIFVTNPSQKNDRNSDLWYVAQFTVNQPAVNQPAVVGQSSFKKATITSGRDMIFDCEAYAYCAQFRVPYSDTGRRDIQEDF